MKRTAAKDIDDYIAGFPPDVQGRLEQVRGAVRKAAPKAEEAISYQIPTFKLNGALIYFAAHKEHIGLYPVTAAIKAALKKELSPYGGLESKGTLRFPFDKPIPSTLIGRIVKLRIKENEARAAARRSRT